MSDLGVRFADHLRRAGWLDGATGVVVGVSGGMDSMTLLHLVRATFPDLPLRAAHVDHRMRDGSGADAAWVADICARWGVRCDRHIAPAPVASEDAGRRLRYRFLEEVRQDLGAGAVTMTAHTADDQAETVLFRAARGSGIGGLAGILPTRAPSLVRPLLPFWRREVAAHAKLHAIPHRDDPTNRDPRWTRNRLRHQILPALDQAVPGAAAALAALAETSQLHAAALDELLDARIAALTASGGGADPESLSLDRRGLCALSDPVLAMLLRRAAARLGGSAGRGATAALVRFARESPSGRQIDVGGGVVAERHLDVVRLARRDREPRPHHRDPAPPPPPASQPPPPPRGPAPPPPQLGIDAHATGDHIFHGGHAAGAPVRVAWGPAVRRGFPHVARIACDRVPFPLVLRAWSPGDRIEMPYGRKKVKKLLLEARIPAHRRAGFPVLVDAAGRLLWLPGVTRPVAAARVPPGGRACCVEVSFDHEP